MGGCLSKTGSKYLSEAKIKLSDVKGLNVDPKGVDPISE